MWLKYGWSWECSPPNKYRSIRKNSWPILDESLKSGFRSLIPKNKNDNDDINDPGLFAPLFM